MLERVKRLLRSYVITTWQSVGAPFAILGRRRGWAAAVYYAFFSRQFWREQQAFLAGRHRYEQDVKNPTSSVALLRRNIHRLEKGLLMRPRRVPFGRDYIDETLTCFERAGGCDGARQIHADEYKWATDVLREYFGLMPRDEWFDGLRVRFERLSTNIEEGQARYIPYPRDLTKPPPITYDQLLELAWRRRSVRWFLAKPVPREMIDRALLVGGLSPSACNRQPYTFRVVDEPELRTRVAGIPFGLQGYGQNVPVLVVLIGRQRNYFHERDRHLIYIDTSLAAMAFIFALEAQGLASCCVNWPDLADRERTMCEALKLEPDERPVMLIALGYPDPEGMVAYSQKKVIAQLRQYNLSHDH